jgi:CRP-like cAMP-binding protein
MPKPYNFQNQLLARLPSAELAMVVAKLEYIELPRSFVLATSKQQIEHVYFLEEGIGSIVAVSPEGQKAEAGMFGFEGFAPTPPAVGSTRSFHEVVIQSHGFGHRLDVCSLQELMQECVIFATLLIKTSHNLATQVSYTALSNATHLVNERLARWLLMCHDRVREDEISITHDYIALMLAVRRPSVTTALHVLEGNRFIRSERGFVAIRDRRAMEEFAQDAYGLPEEEYRYLFR